MLKVDSDTIRQREMALADGVREVASELRLIDATDLVAFIRTGQLANISHLVNSAAELFYQPGAILFGQSADVDLAWGAPPAVVLGLEFHHPRVSAYFRLMLESRQAAVEMDYISFEEPSADPDENTAQLARAIAEARLSPARAPDQLPDSGDRALPQASEQTGGLTQSEQAK